jgi:hypothetical protein
MTASNKPLQTGFTRVFIIAGRARGDHRPEYYSNLKMGGIAQSFGDITKIEIPDPNEYGKYMEVDRIRGAVERATFTLMGRFAVAVKSRMLELARNGCPVDVQVHMGECTDPSNFNVFTKAIISEDSVITNHSTEDLGALESGENAVVNETADISAKDYYEILPLSFTARAGDIIINHVNAIAVIDTASCGSCATESNGCQKIFAVTDAAGGSPGTSPDVLFSLDGGATWRAHDVDTLLTTENADDVAGVGEYVVVVSNTPYSISYALIQDFIDLIDPVFTETTTGFVANRGGRAIWSVGRKAFIVGSNGYIYFTEDPTAGVTVLDAGVATGHNLNAVHALDEENAVAVGNNGAVVYTRDRLSWDSVITPPVGITVNLTGVFMKSETEWWVTASNGMMFYTLNSGKSWVQKTLPGTTPSQMNDISFAKDSIGYAAGVVNSRARIYRSFDGGYSWVVLPESGTLPAADQFNAIATCRYDPNVVFAAGVHDNATDGVIFVGKA